MVFTLHGRVSGLFPILFLALLFSGSFSAVLFENDLEAGVTHLADKVDSGAHSLLLIPNGRIEEWPLTGGRGILDWDITDRREAFSYARREGFVLMGVLELKGGHLRGADVRFGSLSAFRSLSGEMALDTFPPLSGAYSLSSGLTGTAISGAEFPISISPLVHVRFYAVFRKPVLVADKRRTAGTYGYYFFRMDEVTEKSVNKVMSLWMSDIFTGHPDLKLFFNTREGYQGVVLRPDIRWEEPACIEVKSRVGETRDCGVELFWNGKSLYSDFTRDVSWIRGVNRVDFSRNCTTGTEILCPVIYDDIKAATEYIGPLPPAPDTVCVTPEKRLKWHFLLGPQGSALVSCQMLLNDRNDFMEPFHNSGEVLLSADSSLEIPSGLDSAKTYFLRLRFKDRAGNWGHYSRSFIIRGIQTRPLLPWVKALTLSKGFKAQDRPVLEAGQWYDLSLYPENRDGLKNLVNLFLWAHSESDPFGNPGNKGGMYAPACNLVCVVNGVDKQLYGRDSVLRTASVGLTGKKGEYLDDKDGRFLSSMEKGLVRFKLKIPEQAEPGLWTFNVYTDDLNGRPYALFKKTYIVPLGKKYIRPYFGLCVILLLLSVAGLGVFFRKKAFGRTIVPLEREEEIVLKGVHYIDANFKTIRSVTEVSTHIGLSHGYFRSLFKKRRKQRLVDYLVQVRIKRACNLLAETNLSVAETMYEVGFEDVSYFTKIFKKVMGVAPTQYRQKFRKN